MTTSINPTRSTLLLTSQLILLLGKNCCPLLDSLGIISRGAQYLCYTLSLFLQFSTKQRQLCHWSWAWDSISRHDTATLSLFHQLLPQHLLGGGPVEGQVFYWCLCQSSPAGMSLCRDWLLGRQYEAISIAELLMSIFHNCSYEHDEERANHLPWLHSHH